MMLRDAWAFDYGQWGARGFMEIVVPEPLVGVQTAEEDVSLPSHLFLNSRGQTFIFLSRK